MWISAPTWPNHNAIFKAVGINIRDYRYYDKASHSLDWDGMIEDLQQAQAGDVVLLHGCCHNPAGIDPRRNNGRHWLKFRPKKAGCPCLTLPIKALPTAWSQIRRRPARFRRQPSRNAGGQLLFEKLRLYNERVGAFTLVAADEETAARAFSQVKSIIRTLYSNPASHGGSAVAIVLQDEALKAQWVAELDEMRRRIKEMRRQLWIC